jgi:hypothetical protein
MAITDNAIAVSAIPTNGETWSVSAYSADLSGGEELKAAVTGSSHYVMKIWLNSASAISLNIGAGETGGAVTTTYLGPIVFTAAGPNYELDFTEPASLPLKGMKLPVGESLTIDATGAGATAVYVEGKTCKDPPL